MKLSRFEKEEDDDDEAEECKYGDLWRLKNVRGEAAMAFKVPERGEADRRRNAREI
jgi:hypothetical protein